MTVRFLAWISILFLSIGSNVFDFSESSYHIFLIAGLLILPVVLLAYIDDGEEQMTNIQLTEAVRIMYDIARQVKGSDEKLAEDILACAEKLNKMKPLLDGDLAEIKRAT